MALQSDSMEELPFIFTYRDFVYGTRLLSEVTARGRVLAVREEGGWWMYGVDSGDLSASGRTPAEAHAEFRKAFTAILFDIAEDASSYDEFAKQVKAFFSQINEPVQVAWREAVAIVRSKRLAEDTDMTVLPADTRMSIEVVLKQQSDFTTDLNQLDEEPALAA